jgi:phenylalanine-4-hydroxylase
MKDPKRSKSEDKSAYERAADAGVDPRCIPVRLSGPPVVGDAIPSPAYSDEEHETWRLLLRRQRGLLEGRGCDEYIRGVSLMQFPEDRIPALSELSRTLERRTGWRVARAPGLLHERDFFSCLAERIFPSTDYIRPRYELDYTPAPDLFHDMFGHMPMITDEFGLIRTPKGVRIYGNGVLSSAREITHCLSTATEVRPFDIAEITEQDYDVSNLQPLLYVIDTFEQLERTFDEWANSRGL